MKRSTLLKLALSVVTIFVFLGAQAQNSVFTIKLNNGANAAAATMHLVTNGVEGAAIGTADGTGVLTIASASLTATSVYGFRSSDGLQHAVYTYPGGNVTKTIQLYITTINADYVQANEATYQTAGMTFRLYVAPDPLFNPGYDGTGASLSTTSRWTWTYDATLAGLVGSPAHNVVSAAQTNWVEFTTVTAGTYTVNVKESNTSPVCADATGTNQTVNVIAVPAATASIAPVGWVAITPNVSYQTTGNQVAQTVTLTLTENVPAYLAAYSFAVFEKIENIDGGGAVIATPQAWTLLQDYTPASKLKTGNLGALTNVAFDVTGAPDFELTFDSDALDIVQIAGVDARTKYSYAFVQTGTLSAGVTAAIAASNVDFRSAISQKSERLAGTTTYYDITNNELSFIINPNPVTGPIYHIPNTFNL